MAPKEHVIDPTKCHHSWDKSLAPALVIESSDTVHFDLMVAGSGHVDLHSKLEDVVFDWDKIYILSGPVFVNGAHPGDTLRIDILNLKPGAWGWAMMQRGLGLLPEDFPDPYLRTFDLSRGNRAELVPGVEIPFAPFLGTMGVHPGEPDGEHPFPPHRGGGNMDNRHLRQGTTLWLPVWCEGALFSTGDAHALQGDGEVCISALECDMQASLRFTLEKRTIATPQFRSPGPLTPETDARGYHGTMGIDSDLMRGAQTAARAMVTWICEEHGLSPEDAYMLCSFAGDLKIHEIVDGGMWNVGMTLPLCVFTNGS